MTNKKPDLGQGIRALLQNMDSSLNNESPLLGTSNMISLNQIEVNPFQPRHDFNEQALEELANSIRVHGIVQPITVRKIGAKKYQLIAPLLSASYMITLLPKLGASPNRVLR